jgi:ZIP family zinc transporter
MENFGFALLLTMLAALPTGIGGLLAILTKKTNSKFLATSLGFSAGVMIYVSMIELFSKAKESLTVSYGQRNGNLVAMIAFFGGMFFISILNNLITEEPNSRGVEATVYALDHSEVTLKRGQQVKELMQVGLFTAIAVSIHNFLEGLVTFVSALQDLSVAIPVVAAIALHNIPEGIAVAVPIYLATGKRVKAFLYSFLSGLAEPLGAIIGFLFFSSFLTDAFFGIIYAMIAGIMVFVSFDELLPAAREYGEHHLSVYGLIGGMFVMAINMLLFS